MTTSLVTRRMFLTKSTMALGTVAVGSMAFETGCGVWDDIVAYVPAGLNAFNAVITLLEDNGVLNIVAGSAISTAVDLVKGAFADIAAAVTQYENAPVAQKSTLLGKVTTAITAAENALQSFWNTANLGSNPIVTLAEGIVSIILSVLGGFLSQIKPANAVSAVKVASYKHMVTFQPKTVKKVKDFKKLVNDQLVNGGQSKYVIY